MGGLLLAFGLRWLRWLRKSILRSAGLKELHDEDAVFATELAAARVAPTDRRTLVGDWYAFTLSFKGVVLEGLEVAFIAVTFGPINMTFRSRRGRPWRRSWWWLPQGSRCGPRLPGYRRTP